MGSDGNIGMLNEADLPKVALLTGNSGSNGQAGSGEMPAGNQDTLEAGGRPGVEVPPTPEDSVLKELGLVTPSSLDKMCAGAAGTRWVVNGLIARASLNIAVGDSGLGKSPLLYQLGICVAAGIPWLGISTTKGSVVYVDFENAELNSQGLRNALVKHVGLGTCPTDFLTHFGEKFDLHRVVRAVKPVLLIIDSLRSYRPEVEEKNALAGAFLKELRELAVETGTAFLLVHHTRKPHEQDLGALEDTPVMDWLNRASGARSLINQTDFRLGLDRKIGAVSGGVLGVSEEMAMVMRGHRRITGGFGPIHLSRAFDGATGEELGYRKIAGRDLLTPEERQVFDKFTNTFIFKEARTTYNSVAKKGDQGITDFLRKCISHDLLEQPVARGPYKKLKPPAQPTSGPNSESSSGCKNGE